MDLILVFSSFLNQQLVLNITSVEPVWVPSEFFIQFHVSFVFQGPLVCMIRESEEGGLTRLLGDGKCL
jgi:hypothetical protein